MDEAANQDLEEILKSRLLDIRKRYFRSWLGGSAILLWIALAIQHMDAWVYAKPIYVFLGLAILIGLLAFGYYQFPESSADIVPVGYSDKLPRNTYGNWLRPSAYLLVYIAGIYILVKLTQKNVPFLLSAALIVASFAIVIYALKDRSLCSALLIEHEGILYFLSRSGEVKLKIPKVNLKTTYIDRRSYRRHSFQMILKMESEVLRTPAYFLAVSGGYQKRVETNLKLGPLNKPELVHKLRLSSS